jgi:hypothetical protein
MRPHVLFLSLLLLSAILRADGTTGGDVLKTRAFARTAAMGEAGVALAGDLAAFSYNPAGLARLKNPQFAFLHYGQVAGVAVENLAYGHPLTFGTLGGQFLFRSQPDIANRLALDPPVGAYDLILVLAYAGWPSKLLDGLPEHLREVVAGVNLKYLRSHLGRYDADAFAADLGVQFPAGEALDVGVALLNLGTPLKFIEQADPLPGTLLAGVARRFDPLWGNAFSLAVDLEAPLQGRVRMHFGLEDRLSDGLAFRAGYLLDNERSLNGLTAGVGFRLNQEGLLFDFDYAFRPLYYEGFNSFEAQHLFGVQLGF